MDLTTPLQYVKGVGPARGQQLEAKGLLTVDDLLHYPPFRYEDRSNVKPIARLAPGEMATVVAEVRSARMVSFRRRNVGLFEATFLDGSAKLLGKWFQGKYLEEVFLPGRRVALFGKVEFDSYTGNLSMMHPDYEILSGDEEDADAGLHTGRVVPIYEAAGKVTKRIFRRIMHQVLEALPPQRDEMPRAVLEKYKLPDRWDAIRYLHFPPPESDLRLLNAARSPAHFRMIFEEFFWLECGLTLKRNRARAM